jgi:predicted amidophosphoribosyltransferase
MIMETAITYCVNCTAKISAEAATCPECGAEQDLVDRRLDTGGAAPAGWKAAPPAASPTGYTVENP